MKNPTYVRAAVNDAAASGNDTIVLITNSECPICSQYNRHLYSVSGKSATLPRVPLNLVSEGGFCPNCTVQVMPYREGMSLPAEIPMQAQTEVRSSIPTAQNNIQQSQPVQFDFSFSFTPKPTLIAALILAGIGIILTFLPWIDLGLSSNDNFIAAIMAAMDIPNDVSLIESPRVFDRFLEISKAWDVDSENLSNLQTTIIVIRVSTWVIVTSLAIGIISALFSEKISSVFQIVGFSSLALFSCLVVFESYSEQMSRSSFTLCPTVMVGIGVGAVGLALTLFNQFRKRQITNV